MKIKRYGNFSINEKINEDDKYEIDRILVEFIQDHDFDLVYEEVFFDENKKNWSDRLSNICKIPALRLRLYKKNKNDEFTRSVIDNMIGLSYECVGKLSDEFDDVQISKLNFDPSFIEIKFLVFIKSEVKVSDKEGFYTFRDFLINSWRGFDNKVTRSFKLDEVDSESILFKHTETFGQTNATLSEFKRLVSKRFEPKYYQAVRIVYDYECKKEGDDIRVIYKGQKNVDRRGNLVQ